MTAFYEFLSWYFCFIAIIAVACLYLQKNKLNCESFSIGFKTGYTQGSRPTLAGRHNQRILEKEREELRKE